MHSMQNYPMRHPASQDDGGPRTTGSNSLCSNGLPHNNRRCGRSWLIPTHTCARDYASPCSATVSVWVGVCQVRFGGVAVSGGFRFGTFAAEVR